MTTEPIKPDERTKTEQILDLLLDALLERQTVRRKGAEAVRAQAAPAAPVPSDLPPTAPARSEADARTSTRPLISSRPPLREPEPPAAAKRAPLKPAPDEPGWIPQPPVPSVALHTIAWRLLLLVLAVALLINIPVTRYGVSLARIVPDSASLIIRDGLVLKGAGPEIYQLQDGKLVWISSMDAFEASGLTWDDVHVVDDAFLDTFERGEPLHVLVGCHDSPHIYLREGAVKRWIEDIPTFEAKGYIWEDIRWLDCDTLRAIPDGPPIPEDAGTPPQP